MMGAGASFESQEAALAAGKTQEEIDDFLNSNNAAPTTTCTTTSIEEETKEAPAIEEERDMEYLDIPAFLRRQAD